MDSTRGPIATLVSWSSGKDSAWTLYLLQKAFAEGRSEFQPVGLLTTVNTAFDRVAMHSTRRAVLEAQAAAAGLPLEVVPLPWPCSNEVYEAQMRAACDAAIARNVRAMAFGDLYLEDIRAYRVERLRGTGIEPVFPVWQIPTDRLVREMIAAGVKTRVVCVDPRKLAREFAGRDIDEEFLRDLPEGVDPCGENGSFIRACTTGRCSPRHFRLRVEKWWSGMGLCLRMSGYETRLAEASSAGTGAPAVSRFGLAETGDASFCLRDRRTLGGCGINSG
jgi:diphthamide synthase (EF-2-diphthine--ammonia ligase)